MCIGCHSPRNINNTLLLEESGWNGISIDIVNYSNQWKNRKTRFIQADILKMDFQELTELVNQYYDQYKDKNNKGVEQTG